VNDEIDAFSFGHADLEGLPGLVRADEHDEVIEIECSDWVPVGVGHVGVADPAFAGALQDHGIHHINLA
jgi:hypothetical protein